MFIIAAVVILSVSGLTLAILHLTVIRIMFAVLLVGVAGVLEEKNVGMLKRIKNHR